jgi:hypothetical protein
VRSGAARTGLKRDPAQTDNRGMRPALLAGLAWLALASPVRATPLPRGTDDFRLAWSASQVDSALDARGVEVLSRGFDFVTTAGEQADVEYVQYSFATTPQGPSFLWKVTVAYRVPYGRDRFESLRDGMIGNFGRPGEVHASDPDAGNFEDRVTWADERTAVQLGARWKEPQDPKVDRMIVTWTDRRLQKLVEVQRRKKNDKR